MSRVHQAAHSLAPVQSVRQLVDGNMPSFITATRLGLAGHTVLIRYTHGGVAEILSRATRHLTVADAGHSDLTIDCAIKPDLADSVPPEWPAAGATYCDDGSTAFTWEAPEGPLFVYDRQRRHGWALFGSADTVSPWEQATPWRRILHWWAIDRGLRLIHAAAVGNATGGVLLVGRSGSGKSTTSLACLEAGLGFAGDDYCLLSPDDPPQVHSLYLSAKADARAAGLLPGLHQNLAESPLTTWGKSILFADEVRPQSIRREFPLKGIIVPRLAGDTTSRLVRLRPAAALKALAPSTLLQLPGDRSGGLAEIAAVVRSLPAWELILGSPAEAAAIIAELLDQDASR